MIDYRYCLKNMERFERFGIFPYRLTGMGYLRGNFHGPKPHDPSICSIAFYLNCAGSVGIRDEAGKPIPVSTPAAMFFPAGLQFVQSGDAPWDELYFCYPADSPAAEALLNLSGPGWRRVSPSSRFDDLLRGMLELFDLIHLAGAADRLDLQAWALISELLLPGGTGTETIVSGALRGLVRELHRNFRHPVDWPRLLRRYGFSRAGFYRAWKAEIPVPAAHYLLNLRLDFAEKMLKTTRYSSGQVAVECGFQNAAVFNRAYRRRFGHAPLTER